MGRGQLGLRRAWRRAGDSEVAHNEVNDALERQVFEYARRLVGHIASGFWWLFQFDVYIVDSGLQRCDVHNSTRVLRLCDTNGCEIGLPVVHNDKRVDGHIGAQSANEVVDEWCFLHGQESNAALAAGPRLVETRVLCLAAC
jgi:hypothetical protein